jgi:hypothetical protein
MQWSGDEVDDRLRRAARPDEAVVERTVRGVLARTSPRAGAPEGRAWRRPSALALAAVCLIGAAALAAWWWASRTSTDIRTPVAAPRQVITVRATAGMARIFTAPPIEEIVPTEEALPPGSIVVIAGGGAR